MVAVAPEVLDPDGSARRYSHVKFVACIHVVLDSGSRGGGRSRGQKIFLCHQTPKTAQNHEKTCATHFGFANFMVQPQAVHRECGAELDNGAAIIRVRNGADISNLLIRRCGVRTLLRGVDLESRTYGRASLEVLQAL